MYCWMWKYSRNIGGIQLRHSTAPSPRILQGFSAGQVCSHLHGNLNLDQYDTSRCAWDTESQPFSILVVGISPTKTPKKIPNRRLLRQETKEAKSMKSRLEPEAPMVTWNSTQPKVGWWSSILFKITALELGVAKIRTSKQSAKQKFIKRKCQKLLKTHSYIPFLPKWRGLFLKGNYYWRYFHFSLNHDCFFGKVKHHHQASKKSKKICHKSELPESDTKVLNLLPKVGPEDTVSAVSSWKGRIGFTQIFSPPDPPFEKGTRFENASKKRYGLVCRWCFRFFLRGYLQVSCSFSVCVLVTCVFALEDRCRKCTLPSPLSLLRPLPLTVKIIRDYKASQHILSLVLIHWKF